MSIEKKREAGSAGSRPTPPPPPRASRLLPPELLRLVRTAVQALPPALLRLAQTVVCGGGATVSWAGSLRRRQPQQRRGVRDQGGDAVVGANVYSAAGAGARGAHLPLLRGLRPHAGEPHATHLEERRLLRLCVGQGRWRVERRQGGAPVGKDWMAGQHALWNFFLDNYFS
jgi:hypothetical protein